MTKKYSLRKISEICGISFFAWQHKILDILQESIKLNSIVETHEAFIPISYKGNHKDFNFPRLVKKSANTKRGLSKELVCIPYVINFNGKSIAN